MCSCSSLIIVLFVVLLRRDRNIRNRLMRCVHSHPIWKVPAVTLPIPYTSHALLKIRQTQVIYLKWKSNQLIAAQTCKFHSSTTSIGKGSQFQDWRLNKTWQFSKQIGLFSTTIFTAKNWNVYESHPNPRDLADIAFPYHSILTCIWTHSHACLPLLHTFTIPALVLM